MHYVRPFQIDGPAGAGPEWLMTPEEDAECAIRICRAGRDDGVLRPSTKEQFLFVLAGEVTLDAADQNGPAGAGEVIFVPPGAAAEVSGGSGAVWLAIEAPLPAGVAPPALPVPSVIKLDRSKFEGGGFAWQVMTDRAQGAQSLRSNVVQVQPGSGSPDYHIHAFAQVYLIQAGTMTIDIGHKRYVANANTLVYLPAGVVHRNFNSSPEMEQHMSLLMPEPAKDEIFDFAVTIHDHEAKMLTSVP